MRLSILRMRNATSHVTTIINIAISAAPRIRIVSRISEQCIMKVLVLLAVVAVATAFEFTAEWELWKRVDKFTTLVDLLLVYLQQA